MRIAATSLPDVLVIEPAVFDDARGFFYESFNARDFGRQTGINVAFVQDNHSRSLRHVLRGLHFQIRHAQGKLVRVTTGEVLDVAVDLRKNSPAFGGWTSVLLSEENRRQHWIPAGFAHGFLVRSDFADVLYKTTDFWMPEHERSVRWDDPAIGIDWQFAGAPLQSGKDAAAPLLADAEVFD